MDGREVEPRVVLWARAEVSWQDASGAPCRSSGTLEDTSKSGACVRLNRPLALGSTVTVKWQREQFSGVARNCRNDRGDFVVGLRREPSGFVAVTATPNAPQGSTLLRTAPTENHPLLRALQAEHDRRALTPAHISAGSLQSDSVPDPRGTTLSALNQVPAVVTGMSQTSGAPPRVERKDMDSKSLFPALWRRAKQQPEPAISKEVDVNNSKAPELEASTVKHEQMLSYEDIYHAAGIMNPVSGYGIHKVIEMLNSERIRDLSNEIKRASVLMALDAAGTSLEEVLTDATRRREALHVYESGRKKQLEDFEAGKTRENADIEQEMERVRVRYAERMQRNQNLVAEKKEALHNWQMATQHEMKRIAEVMELCGKPASGEAPLSTSHSATTAAGNKIADQARATTAGQGK